MAAKAANPYEQALGGDNPDPFANPPMEQGTPAATTEALPAATAPTPKNTVAAPKSAGKTPAGKNNGPDLSTNPDFTEPDPEATTANTPEAGPNAPTPNVVKSGSLQAMQDLNPFNFKPLYKPKLPTTAQDIHAAMKPDESFLASLPGEYKGAMDQISQYLGGTNTGVPSLDAADAAVNKDIASTNQPVEKALGGLSSAAKEYEGTVPYSSILQSALGFQKYQQSYGLAQPNMSEWSQSMQGIYAYLSGHGTAATGAGGSLPSPTVAAATANPNATIPTASSTGGSNA